MAVIELPKRTSRKPSREDVRLAFEIVGLVGLLSTLYCTASSAKSAADSAKFSPDPTRPTAKLQSLPAQQGIHR